MIKTVVILLFTLIALPLIAIKFDKPLTPQQWHMVEVSFYIMLGFAGLSFLVGEVTGNVSQTDKLWSITPLFYTWTFACLSNWEPRAVLLAVLVSVWGVRLTYNFGRKGGYHWKFWEGEEDYRWSVLRKKPFLNTKIGFTLFNLFFICFYQHALVWLITLPVIVASSVGGGLQWFDGVLAVVFIALVVIETVADQQQWDFQTEKYRRIKSGEQLTGDYADGFLKSGLWAKVRHPKYAAEQAVWIVVYIFSAAASGRGINWSMAGCLLLVILFQGSSDFSEKISADKYPAYKDYQQKVGRFLPKLF